MTLQQVTVEIENVAPQNGTSLTPFWVAFHNGFDTFDQGQDVSPGLESLAEDGATALISQEFAASGQGQIDGTVGGAPIAPGETVRLTFNVDPSLGNAQYFNYASMVLPSNDTFIANDNEFMFEVFDDNGNFIPLDFIVPGTAALDAGTEVNDELPANTAFFGQQMPNTGVDQNGAAQPATGFLPVGSGGILDDPQFANGDYTAAGYEFVRIRVSSNPTAQLTSTLDGAQEVDPGDPDASGTSELILNAFDDALSYSLTVSGLDFGAFIGNGSPQTADTSDDVTRLHIHNGVRGENGPIAFGLIDLVDPAFSGQDDDDLQITLNADGSTTLTGIWEESDPASIALSQFVTELRDAAPGEDVALYWNVHTNEFPAGAIRGQLQGDELVNEINGSAGEDTVQGTGGNDLINGFGGADRLLGRGGDDTLVGGRGPDRLVGGNGNDTLFGNGGRDVLIGGNGRDTITSGGGRDVIVLRPGRGLDTITDFSNGRDLFRLRGRLSFDDLSVRQRGDDVLIRSGSGRIATLEGIDASTIDANDFVRL